MSEELERKYIVGKYANMDILEWLGIQNKVIEKIKNKYEGGERKERDGYD